MDVSDEIAAAILSARRTGSSPVLSTRHLLKVARVCRQWRSTVADIVRQRCDCTHQHWGAGTVDWDAGEALAFSLGSIKPLGRRKHRTHEEQVAIRSAMLKLATAQAFKSLHALPDIALVYVSADVAPSKQRPSQADSTFMLADEVARFLPPFTLVVVIRATGVIGPEACGPEAYSECSARGGWAEPVCENEEGASLVVMLGVLPSTQIGWLTLGLDDSYQRERMRGIYSHGQTQRHAGAWWLPTPVRPQLPPRITRGEGHGKAQLPPQLAAWGTISGGLLAVCTAAGVKSKWLHQLTMGQRQPCLAGGIAQAVAIKVPGCRDPWEDSLVDWRSRFPPSLHPTSSSAPIPRLAGAHPTGHRGTRGLLTIPTLTRFRWRVCCFACRLATPLRCLPALKPAACNSRAWSSTRPLSAPTEFAPRSMLAWHEDPFQTASRSMRPRTPPTRHGSRTLRSSSSATPAVRIITESPTQMRVPSPARCTYPSPVSSPAARLDPRAGRRAPIQRRRASCQAAVNPRTR